MAHANYPAVLKIKITDTAIKITLCTMDLDGEDTFPSISMFLVGLGFLRFGPCMHQEIANFLRK